MGSLHGCYRYFFLWCFLIIGHCCSSIFSFPPDRITGGQLIKDGDLIVSAGQKFALGFFSPQKSGPRYVGIWYYKLEYKSVVWVANRESPISGTGGFLTIGHDGKLILTNAKGQIVWSSNGTALSRNATAVLMDTGNLVLQVRENSNNVLWQSFDNPTDSCLPDMQVHFDLHGREIRRILTSWRSDVDPSPGNYTMGIDPCGSPQVVIWEGQSRRWRSGYWNGMKFTGIPEVRTGYQGGFRLISENDGRVYFVYMPYDRSALVKFRMSADGVGLQEEWIEEGKRWNVEVARPVNECDMYNHCGPFGICNQMGTPRCSCLKGFMPYDSVQWARGNWSGGCIRMTTLQCKEAEETDGFQRITHVKLPDFVDYVGSENARGCEKKCLQNCSCTAYAYITGINCMIWIRELFDVEQFGDGGKTIFVRLAQSELDSKRDSRRSKIISSTIVVVVVLFVLVSIWWLFKRRRTNQEHSYRQQMLVFGPGGDIGTGSQFSAEQQQATGTDLAALSLKDVAAATDNFSNENKLGRGGFGQVYKGMLPGGQEIAVKRLSRKSSQGLEEFKNEITLIAKLQHRNLVRLLGCCTQGEERMLLYEYMPNKSLDSYIFDPDRRALLDWSKRFSIIQGIARGLLYLHRDSRLRIIHRDLKASNILLDGDMNPKISDFGMARIFGGNENEASTMRVVGTYGYMAPEYAMEGLFSLKSDVYSFGVLLLEIIIGQRNISFRSEEEDYSNIIGYAWDLWRSGRAVELLDSSISESCPEKEQVARCVHVGMLCVQDMAADRPSMQGVVMMLEGDSTAGLPAPSRRPSFTSRRHNNNGDRDMCDGINVDVVSVNDVSISEVSGR